jgi:hypothetical protein
MTSAIDHARRPGRHNSRILHQIYSPEKSNLFWYKILMRSPAALSRVCPGHGFVHYALCKAFRAASSVAKTRTFPSFERKQSSPVLAIQGRDGVPRHAER